MAKEVTSSCLSKVGYSWLLRVLVLTFTSGATYKYFNVPHDIYKQLLKADSKGKFFRANVLNKYEYKRIA